MKRPFPVYRTSTLTRANVELFRSSWIGENAPSPREIAEGVIGHKGEKAVTEHHVKRVLELLKGR